MRLFLALFFLAVTSLATAGDFILPCTGTLPPRPAPTAVRVDEFPAQITPATPKIGGTCGSYIADANAAGIAFGYWCQTAPDKTPRPWMWAVRWSSLTPEMMASFLAIKLAADPGEAARLHQVKYATMSFWDMADVWCEPASDWRVRFNAAQPVVQAPPPPAAWRTPATGSGTIYIAAGARLGSIVAGRKAPPNTACTCPATPIVYYGGTFCPLTTGPATEVTLCRLS